MSSRLTTLVIVSVPFQRLVRSHLSPLFLDFLSRQSMVAVVSPFAFQPDFTDQHRGPAIQHVFGPSENDISWIARKLFAVSTLLRTQGYYFRFRSELSYYWRSRHISYLANGCDCRFPLQYRLISDFLALIGYWRGAWKLFDELHAEWSYKCPALTALANGYDEVILIQSASWGFQDAALASLARKGHWRTVLIPYTIDQLHCNGYLYSDFASVCVQGSNEYRFARKFHNVSEQRIVKLGSVYMRVLNSAMKERVHTACNAGSKKKRIMYAGLTPQYFPEVCEIEAVNTISRFIIDKFGENWELLYRPARHSREFLLDISNKLHFPEKVLVDIPSPNSLGLDSYVVSNALSAVENIVDLFSNMELLVTSTMTSLSLEAAFFGVPSIIYFPEDNQMLRSRQTDLLYPKETGPLCMESVPVARNMIELIKLVEEVLSSFEMQQEIATALIKEWDYPDADFEHLLDKAVFDASY